MYTKDKKYLIAAIFFVLLEILTIMRNVINHDYASFLWFCDSVPIFFALAFFFKKEQIVKGLINVVFLYQNVYLVGALLTFLFGIYVPFVGHMHGLYAALLALIVHMFSGNVALFFTYDVKPKASSLLYSIAYGWSLGFLTLLFTPAGRNINLIYHATALYQMSYGAYLWFVLFVVSLFPNYGAQHLIYYLTKKKKSPGSPVSLF